MGRGRPRGGPDGTYLTPKAKRDYWYEWAAKNRMRLKRYQRSPKYLAARNAGMKKWYARTKAEILAGKVCVCCGDLKVGLDHIAGVMVRKNALNLRRHTGQDLLRDYKRNPTNYQFLCRRCNSSKNAESECRLHGKYLGIWNHLQPLFDLG